MNRGEIKDKENQEKISKILNDFSFSARGLCENMSHDHRTLQQTFTRLCIEWLLTCAQDSYLTDGRNEASKELAQDLVKAYEQYKGVSLKDCAIPLI